MKKSLAFFLFAAVLLPAPAAFTQIRYEKGYVVGNDGVRQEAWILDQDKMDNPVRFTYKLNEDGAPRAGSLGSVREFGFGDVRFRRYQVDVPSDATRFYQYDAQLQFARDTVYLKVLENTSDILLLELSRGNFNWYYYAVPDDEQATFLVYKEYLKTERMRGFPDNARDYLHRNNQYRNQILMLFRDKGLTEDDVLSAGYTGRDLARLWQKAGGRIRARKSPRVLVPGVFVVGGMTRFYLKNTNTRSVIKAVPSYGAGVDLEFVFPFSKEKLSLGFSPQFERMYAPSAPTLFSVRNGRPETDQTSSVDVKYFEIPLSFRYRMFVSENAWFYLKSGVGYFLTRQSTLSFPVYRSRQEVSVTEGMDFFVGSGFHFNRHLGLELGYKIHSHSTRNLPLQSWGGSRPAARGAELGLYWYF